MHISPPTPPPFPVPSSEPVIKLPADQYLHPGAPTEWWWHMGTLKAGEKTFGFQINAASFTVMAFTQVMLTDVSTKLTINKPRSTPRSPPTGPKRIPQSRGTSS